EAGAGGIGARYVPWEAVRSLRNAARETRDLARILDGLSADVVHLHSAKAGLAGRLALRGRRPTIFQPHGWSFLALNGLSRRAALEWERRGASLADVIVCVSEGELATGRA